MVKLVQALLWIRDVLLNSVDDMDEMTSLSYYVVDYSAPKG
jgi:hypothetical protein